MIEIIRTGNQGLTQRVYQFSVRAEDYGRNPTITVRLEAYFEQSKSSRRHRSWGVDARWYRPFGSVIVHRDTTTAKPEVPDDVKQELELRVSQILRLEF